MGRFPGLSLAGMSLIVVAQCTLVTSIRPSLLEINFSQRECHLKKQTRLRALKVNVRVCETLLLSQSAPKARCWWIGWKTAPIEVQSQVQSLGKSNDEVVRFWQNVELQSLHHQWKVSDQRKSYSTMEHHNCFLMMQYSNTFLGVIDLGMIEISLWK